MSSFSACAEMGGKQAVQGALANAIKHGRDAEKVHAETIDKECGFDGQKFAKIDDILQDPTKVTGRQFSIISGRLGLTLEDAFASLNLKEGWKTRATTAMAEGNGRAVAALGPGDPMNIPLDDQAELFLWLKALAELD